MALALGNLDAGVDIDQSLVQPFAVAPDQRVAGSDPTIGLALSYGNIDLGPGKADDKSRLSHSQHIREHPTRDVDRMTHRLAGDTYVGRAAQFFQVGQTRVPVSDK